MPLIKRGPNYLYGPSGGSSFAKLPTLLLGLSLQHVAALLRSVLFLLPDRVPCAGVLKELARSV